MTLTEEIQTSIKSKNAIIGYKESISFIKLNSAKLIVIAKNAPEKIKKEIEYNAKIAGIEINVFDGTSKQLGLICGKSFPVTTIVIK